MLVRSSAKSGANSTASSCSTWSHRSWKRTSARSRASAFLTPSRSGRRLVNWCRSADQPFHQALSWFRLTSESAAVCDADKLIGETLVTILKTGLASTDFPPTPALTAPAAHFRLVLHAKPVVIHAAAPRHVVGVFLGKCVHRCATCVSRFWRKQHQEQSG